MRNRLVSGVIVAVALVVFAGCWGPNINKDLDRVGTFPKRFEPGVFNSDAMMKQAQLAKGRTYGIKPIAQTPGARIRVIETSTDVKLQYHKRHDEILFVLQGEGVMEIDGIRDPVSVSPRVATRGKPPVSGEGILVVIPRGKKFRFINPGRKPLTMISVLIPNTDDKDTKFVKVKKKKKRPAPKPMPGK